MLECHPNLWNAELNLAKKETSVTENTKQRNSIKTGKKNTYNTEYTHNLLSLCHSLKFLRKCYTVNQFLKQISTNTCNYESDSVSLQMLVELTWGSKIQPLKSDFQQLASPLNPKTDPLRQGEPAKPITY